MFVGGELSIGWSVGNLSKSNGRLFMIAREMLNLKCLSHLHGSIIGQLSEATCLESSCDSSCLASSILWSGHLEILHAFVIINFAFSFYVVPHKYFFLPDKTMRICQLTTTKIRPPVNQFIFRTSIKHFQEDISEKFIEE